MIINKNIFYGIIIGIFLLIGFLIILHFITNSSPFDTTEYTNCIYEAETVCALMNDKTKTSENCDMINDESVKQACKAKTLAGTIFENKDRDSCFKLEEFGFSIQDCNKIIDAIEKEDINICKDNLCKDIFYGIDAIKSNNEVTCNSIYDETIKRDCMIMTNQNLEYCDYSPCTVQFFRPINEIEKKINTEKVCKNIKNTKISNICLKDLAEQKVFTS